MLNATMNAACITTAERLTVRQLLRLKLNQQNCMLSQFATAPPSSSPRPGHSGGEKGRARRKVRVVAKTTVTTFDDHEWSSSEGEVRGCTGPLVPVWHYDLNILSNMSSGFSHIHNPNVTVHNGFSTWSTNGRKRA